MVAGWLQARGNSVLVEGHGPCLTSGEHFTWPFSHSGGLPACPAESGFPRDAQTSLPAGMRPWRGGRTFQYAARIFPRAGRTPRGHEGTASQSRIGKAPHCGAGRSPPAGKTCAPAGRRSPRGGTRSPRGPSMSPCSGWSPLGAKRPFPEVVRPFYTCNGAKKLSGGPTAQPSRTV